MQTAPRDLGVFRGSSSLRARAIAVFLVAVAIVLLLGVGEAGRSVLDLEHRRDEALAARSDPADVAGETADAFRQFRSTLGEGNRFALLFAPDVGRDQRGFYRLVALSYLYPAIAASDPGDANAVMVFGEPSRSVRAAFDEIGVVNGVWLGRRRA